jgi:tetratricopeptide (TPR) repeat protein
MSENTMFEEALDAISKGQRGRARDLLTRLLRADQANPLYWLWMSSVVDTLQERVYCLESVLKVDPENAEARQGLVILGAKPAIKDIKPVPPFKRRWGHALDEEETPKNAWQKITTNRPLKTGVFFGLGVVMVFLMFLGIFGAGGWIKMPEPAAARKPTNTFGPAPTFTNTPTLLPTKTLVAPSPTPTFSGATPLWVFLEATYTPIPLYVNTPHPINDAYRTGVRAYLRGDWEGMLKFMLQASDVDPYLADIHFHVGEAYRLLKNFPKALQSYEHAISLNSQFAPSYIGRARVLLITNPSALDEDDFLKAIELDPNLVEAYLVRANYYLKNDKIEEALEDLEQVELLFPEYPPLYIAKAKAHLLVGDIDAALESALIGHSLDFTLLEGYLVLSEAHLLNGDLEEATRLVDIYLIYEDDPAGWFLLGQVQFNTGNKYEEAIKSFSKALQKNNRLIQAQFFRGQAYLHLGETKSAVNDLVAVHRDDPISFKYSLTLAQALFADKRENDALKQLTNSEGLADSNRELAEIYYWRAQVQEELNNSKAAIIEWQALLALPEEDVPTEWRRAAELNLERLLPATPTPTLTPGSS